MSSGDIQKQIEFIIDQQAKFSADIDLLKESQRQLTEDVRMLTGAVAEMREQMDVDRQETREMVDRILTEMRDDFKLLIASDEKTTNLMVEIGLLAVNNSKRISKLESERGDEGA